MGFFKRKTASPEEPETTTEPEQSYYPGYIDLGQYSSSARSEPSKGKQRGREIKLAEIESYEDIRYLAGHIYDGNILILDFTSIANDELTLKRIINELQRLVEDVNGDLAGISNNLLIVSPRGVHVSRKKLRKGLR